MATQAQIPDVQRQNALLNRLLEVSLILNSNLALRPLLNYIMEATCEITESEAASILLYEPKKSELRFVASNSPGTDVEKLSEIPVPMENSIAGQIFRENRPIVIQDPADPRIYRPVDNTIGFRTRTLLGVPMQIRGKVIGVIESVNKRTGLWTDDDRHYLSILASHAAVAIENARQSEALKKAYDELHKIDKLKSDFIAIASHELRTPLGIILGYASFLQEEAQGEASQHAGAVLKSALHLRDLIEDLTQLRFLQLGKADLIRENVPVAALLDTAQRDAQSLIKAKNHTFNVTNAARGDMVVNVDRLKIGMALSNLINNAVKFTPDGGNIDVVMERHSHEAWIKVCDNGVGIEAENLDKIFEQFYQSEDHMTRRHNGMGIGLAIARGMVQAHGGRLWAESDGTGKGATFCIVLPLAE